MFLDFEDQRPETPTIPRAISLREGVLLSLVFHMGMALVVLLFPGLFASPPSQVLQPVPDQSPPLRFVEVMPLVDRRAIPRRPADQSDLDRRSQTIERAPTPADPTPFSRGNTPDPVVGGPETREMTEAAPPAPPAPPPDADRGLSAATPVPTRARLGESLRNLQQYLQHDNFQNERGGATDQGADIQFDSMGVDFGPWLRRFKNQVERNWIVPPAAQTLKGRVVLQFYVLRNGTITELRIAQPASIEAFTVSAQNALKLSNPTLPLPTEYPADRVFFTVTFYYNEASRYEP